MVDERRRVTLLQAHRSASRSARHSSRFSALGRTEYWIVQALDTGSACRQVVSGNQERRQPLALDRWQSHRRHTGGARQRTRNLGDTDGSGRVHRVGYQASAGRWWAGGTVMSPCSPGVRYVRANASDVATSSRRSAAVRALRVPISTTTSPDHPVRKR